MKNVKVGHSRPVVCLDAGHYGDYNRSPAVWEYFESDMTWKLHLLLKAALEGYGIEVKTTRSNQDSNLGEYERGTASRGCDLFLSLHSNAAGSQVNETADHVIVIVPLNGSGNEIGQMFVDRISLIMGTQQKGRIETRQGNNGDYFGVIRGATAVGTVGMILEHSFHTNTRITNWLLKEENLARLAAEEASIVAEYCFQENLETTGFDYFTEDNLPELATEKNTAAQIKMCFDAHRAGDTWKTLFD